MNAELFNKLVSWIWTTFLLSISTYYYFFLQDNQLHTNVIGAGLLVLIAIRRVLIYYKILSKGNPYLYNTIFFIAIIIPLVAEYYLINPEKGIHLIWLSGLIFGAIIHEMIKKGKFGEKYSKSIIKSEDRIKKQRNFEKRESELQKKEWEFKENKRKDEENKRKASQSEKPTATKYYCKYCGIHTNSLQSLLINKCGHGKNRGNKHVLFEGTLRKQYSCKYCAVKFSTIHSMTINKCSFGKNKDNFHVPVLFE